MNGDPRVVAALAVAVLALPPVVNAIMEQAARQADVDWLRDLDAEGDTDLEPPEGEFDGQGPLPRDLPLPPPPLPQNCTEMQRGPSLVLQPPAESDRPTGALVYETEPGDLILGAGVRAEGVTGSPTFRLTQDETLVWEHNEFHVRESFELPSDGSGVVQGPTPGVTWRLEYDVTNVLHAGLSMAIQVTRCQEAGP